MRAVVPRSNARASRGRGVHLSASTGLAVSLAILALASTRTASADVVVTDTTRHYPLHGTTLQALRSALQAGIPEAQPDHPSGMTVAKLRWEASYQPTPTGCRVAMHRVTLDITTVLPEWRERMRAPVRLRGQWDRAYAALAAHEAGHRALSIESAHALDALVAGFSSTRPCHAASLNLQWQVWKLQQRLQHAQARFDRTTGSGRKQGAVL